MKRFARSKAALIAILFSISIAFSSCAEMMAFLEAMNEELEKSEKSDTTDKDDNKSKTKTKTKVPAPSEFEVE